MSSFFSIIGIVLIGLAGPAAAQSAAGQSDPQQEAKERAALIDACVKEMRGSLKAGQHMTNQQRMMAEEACRARVDAQMQSRRAAPKQ